MAEYKWVEPRRKAKRQTSQPLTEEQRNSLWSEIGASSLGALSKVGALIDLPASSARDIVTGNNPFDQWLTPLSHENRATGADVLEPFLGKNEETGFFSNPAEFAKDTLRFGAEVALDPLWFLGTGTRALKPMGRAVKKSGLLDYVPKIASEAMDGAGFRLGRSNVTARRVLQELKASRTPAEYTKSLKDFVKAARSEGIEGRLGREAGPIDEAVGSLFSLSAPGIGEYHFGGKAGTTTGKIAHMLDKAAAKVKASTPGVYAKGLFSRAAGDSFDPEVQKFNEEMFARIAAYGGDLAVKDAELRADILSLASDFHEIGITHGLASEIGEKTYNEGVGGLMNHYIETGKLDGTAYSMLGMSKAKDRVTPAMMDKFAAMRQKAVELNRPAFENYLSKGGNSALIQESFIDDSLEYFHREVQEIYRNGGGVDDVFRAMSTMPGSAKGRTPVIKGLPALVPDSIYKHGNLHRGGFDHIRSELKRLFQSEDANYIKGYKYTDELGNEVFRNADEHLDDLTDWAIKSGKSISAMRAHATRAGKQGRTGVVSKAGQYLYSKDIARVAANNTRHMIHANASLDAIHEAFRRSVTDVEDFAESGFMSLDDAYKVLNMNPETSKAHFAKMVLKDELTGAEGIPVEIVDKAAAFMAPINNPTWAKEFSSVMNKLTNPLKTWLTVPWPGFASRNYLSGQTVNLTSGDVPISGFKDYFQSHEAVRKFLSKRGDEEARQFGFELDGHNVFGSGVGFQDVEIGSAAERGIMPNAPTEFYRGSKAIGDKITRDADNGAINRFFQGELDEATGLPANPESKFRKARQAANTWVAGGQEANRTVEYLNRATMYHYLTRKRGWSKEAAAARVRELQFDYSASTKFERDVMKTVFPFYSFSRFMAPLTVKTLIEKPGGALSAIIKASSRSHGGLGPLPDHVTRSMAIPVGEDEEGGKEFLTGFGLAHEDVMEMLGVATAPLELIAGGGATEATNSLKKFGYEMLSRTHPAIKGPLEYAVGQSFFQGGRELEKLDPSVTRAWYNVKEQLGLKDPEDRYIPKDPLRMLGEQAIMNTRASRAITTFRKLTDTRRSWGSVALNSLTGAGTHIVSPGVQENILRERAAEEMLDLGAKQYSNVYFYDDIIERLPEGSKSRALLLNALKRDLDRKRRARN